MASLHALWVTLSTWVKVAWFFDCTVFTVCVIPLCKASLLWSPARRVLRAHLFFLVWLTLLMRPLFKPCVTTDIRLQVPQSWEAPLPYRDIRPTRVKQGFRRRAIEVNPLKYDSQYYEMLLAHGDWLDAQDEHWHVVEQEAKWHKASLVTWEDSLSHQWFDTVGKLIHVSLFVLVLLN